MFRTAVVAGTLAVLLTGCGGRLACEDPARYAGSGTIPPVQVPDDLSPPDESQSLAIPPEPERTSGPAAGACLDSPPSYFDERA